MTKSRSQAGSQPAVTPPVQPTANEGMVRPVRRPDLRLLAVPTFSGMPDEISRRQELVEGLSQELTLEELEQLMVNVQVAQRSFTESLNRLSLYRKRAIAPLLETRRRARAQAARQAAQGQQAPGPGLIQAGDLPFDAQSIVQLESRPSAQPSVPPPSSEQSQG